jgi:DNA-binding LacI/PurR family transcriptional regulator
MRAILRRGLRVPEDIAVVGFDDTEDARFSTPSLTTVAPGRDALARAAVLALHRRITEPGYLPGQDPFVADFRLVVRESTGGPAEAPEGADAPDSPDSSESSEG